MNRVLVFTLRYPRMPKVIWGALLCLSPVPMHHAWLVLVRRIIHFVHSLFSVAPRHVLKYR